MKNRIGIVLFLSFNAIIMFAQDGYKNLVKAAKEECRTYPFATNCGKHDRIIEKKFKNAIVYLKQELADRTLCDTGQLCDDDYEQKLAELSGTAMPEDQQGNGNFLFAIFSGKRSTLSDEERLCLLVSLLRPAKSHHAFNKLFHSFYPMAPAVEISEDSWTYYYYKMWLYELLSNRFKNPDYPLKAKAAVMYNKAIDIAETDFKDIEIEKKLINTIDGLLKEALVLDTKLTDKDRIAEIFAERARKMSEYFYQKPSADLEKYIEEIFSKALVLSPDNPKINYNFGAFYYNRAVGVSKDMDAKQMRTESQMKEMEELFEKAKPYLEKAEK